MIYLSNNSASKARSCWKKYKFYAIDKLLPLKKSRAFSLGENVHKAFERIYNNEPKELVLDWLNYNYDSQIQDCLPEEQEDLKIDKFTALGMVEFFPSERLKFQECYPEVEFQVSLGSGVRLIGRVDGKVKQENKKWLREFKTTSLDLQRYFKSIDTTYQASGYKFAFDKLEKEKYEGVIYDVLRKPRLYKRSFDTADTYGKRIYQDYALTEKDAQKRDSYFGRFYLYRNEFQMQCFVEDMNLLAKEIRSRTKTNNFPRNPDACFSYNRMCEYYPICWKQYVTDELIDAYYYKYKYKEGGVYERTREE